ncbi:MAG: UDP-N-acetylmuramoyl-L-alanine--D-glutamate ligase [Anaerolineae bacterium]|nr:UDP-N-acetylmuramoyl-L-alanine--D-glutamate ligase [Anaerolineae bacterium]
MNIDGVKQVVVVGLARQGMALARFFCARGAQVTITDLRAADELQAQRTALAGLSIAYVLGAHPFSLLDRCDLLCLSGGVPPETPLPQEARRRGIALSNDSLLTLQLAPTPMIGVTGSSGKTTTTTLVGEMLRQTPFRTWVGGNIGTPLIDRIDEIAPGDRLLLELSSFQLQLFDRSPHVGAVLNITPNHLDRHPSMSHYAAAKANILRWQERRDIAVLGVDDAVVGAWWRDREVAIGAGEGQDAVRFPIHARRIGFSLARALDEGACLRGDRLVWRDGQEEHVLCTTGELRLLGRHNVANVLAACAVAGAVGASAEAMRAVATTFAGVAHRLELVRTRDGVSWYNDSIATAPERVCAALRAFDQPVVLLAGGRDKHLPWDEMADLAISAVRHLILFGEAADLIAGQVAAAQVRAGPDARGPQVHHCADLDQAVARAAQVARSGDVVLLSPGGTSFDAYRDFEERGRHFRALVEAL